MTSMVPYQIFCFVILIITLVNGDYWSERAEFVRQDLSQSLGSSLKLDRKEAEVNRILMKYKYEEYDAGFEDPQTFLPAIHFFHSKERIEQSEVFKFIQRVPKGSSLHSHDYALVSFEYLYNLTYTNDLYGCILDGKLNLNFFANVTNDYCNWKMIKELRQEDANFDNFIKSELSLVVDDPTSEYPNINVVWAEFNDRFATVLPMISYKPVFQDYFYQALQELYDDGIMYLEFRGTLPGTYHIDGTQYGPEETVELYIETLELFKEHNPDFFGARLIYAPVRDVDNDTANEYVKIAKNLKQRYPDFIAGFDLVGEEDKGKPLVDFMTQLLELSGEMKFFFHAAETDWSGKETDFNLVDAVLLNTTRIGHGYGVVKHPEVLKSVKEKHIAIEISPISNQVLKLVDDLRNHPGAFLIANDFPVVICCDDPTFWGAKGLSYDWYMAFMGFSSRENDLRLLKQFAINSIIYSAMENQEKIEALAKWQIQWDKFIDQILDLKRKGQFSDSSVQV